MLEHLEQNEEDIGKEEPQMMNAEMNQTYLNSPALKSSETPADFTMYSRMDPKMTNLSSNQLIMNP